MTQGLGGLVAELSKIDGIDRIRYMTSHPRDMDDDLIAAHATNEKLMPFLHLPVQAGSDRILKAMNRGHTAEHYIRLIEKVRKARADIAISGDFIVGFPGETEEDFADTLGLVKEVNFASAFSFNYSARPGTPAADMKSQVPRPVALERLYRLQALIHDQQTAFNRASVGKTLPVLIEKKGRDPGQMVGKSPYLQAVHLNAPEAALGRILPVIIDGVGRNTLSGHIEGAVHDSGEQSR